MVPADSSLDLVLDAHAAIAESLLWEPRAGVLYWVDVKAPALFRLDPVRGDNRRWELPEDIGAFALADGDEAALVALRSGLFLLSLHTGALERVVAAPWDPSRFRFNEGACDAEGWFWVGCMCDPKPGADQTKVPGPLHTWSSAAGLVHQHSDAECHNGMAWSPDGGTFYLSHSMERTILAYPVGSGRLGSSHVFARPDGPGIPDGAATDEEGAYWCAIHGGGCLHRYSASGELLRVVELPVSLPTMCVFGGPDLRTLFISSASDQLSPAQRRQEKLAGSILRLDPSVRGLQKPTHAR